MLQGGQRELVLDVDDNLINSGSANRTIPREDVAELCVQALLLPEADNRWGWGCGSEGEERSTRSVVWTIVANTPLPCPVGLLEFDCGRVAIARHGVLNQLCPPARPSGRSVDVVSKPPEAGAPTTDFKGLFSKMPRNCSYADMEARVGA